MSDCLEQTTLGAVDRGEGETRQWRENKLKEMCFTVLPKKAKAEGWPIVFDHCIARVCYDVGCGGVWYDEVDGKPFYSEATDRQLGNAVGVALRMDMDGREYVARKNEQSLLYRGEIEPEQCNHYYGHDDGH